MSGEEGYQRNKVGEGPKIDFRALVRDKDAGMIIGKRGANIKNLRMQYNNAVILLPDGKGQERVLLVDAELGTVCEILFKMFLEYEEFKQLKEEEKTGFVCDIHVLVPHSLVGYIIGSKASRIKDIKNSTGATIVRVFQDILPYSTEFVVWIKGTLNSVIDCVDKLFMVIHKGPAPRNELIQFDPVNFPVEHFGQSFNFTDDKEMPAPSNAFGEYYGGYKDPYGARAAAKAPFEDSSQPSVEQSVEPTETKKFQCTIPQNLVGFIIGQGGDRIAWIRQRSKAGVKISKAEAESDVCVATLTGSEEQIEAAQYYLLQAAKEAVALETQRDMQALGNYSNYNAY